MRAWRIATVAVVLTAAIIFIAACGRSQVSSLGQQGVSEAELSERFPWLAQTLADWAVEADLTAGAPAASELGAYPIGNGRCFGFEGARYPLNALVNLVGPSYQKSGPLWAVTPVLSVQGEPRAFERQRIAWVGEAPIVATSCATADGLRLDTYDFASPQTAAIVRVFVVSNDGERAARGVELALAVNTAATDAAGRALSISGERRLLVGFVGRRSRFRDKLPPASLPEATPHNARPPMVSEQAAVTTSLGVLRPGRSVAGVAFLAFSTTEQDEQQVLAAVSSSDPFSHLDTCRQAWADEFGQTTQVSCPDSRVGSLIEIQKRIIAAQQAAEGGFSPMDKYSFLWVRDSNGPVRFMSTIGAHERVKRALEYHFRGCAQQKAVGNNMPLNLEAPAVPADFDWSQVPVERAEVPSLAVLQRYWYWRCSDDRELIRRQMGMLRRCMEGQQVDERGRLPFHGDETYRFPGYILFNAGQEAPDHVCLETMSADSGFAFWAATRALRQMQEGTRSGADGAVKLTDDPRALKIRDALERFYWQADRAFYAPAMSDFTDEVHRYPFAPVNLAPIWVGYGNGQEERQQRNVLEALKYLWKENGTVKTSPSFGPYVTLTLGYLLHSLAAIGHPAAEAALEGLLSGAERSGGYAEMNTPDDRPSDAIWGEHRIRPWEGGINAEAVLYYLTGFEPDAANRAVTLCPQMPLSWEDISVSNLRVGDFRFGLEVKRGVVTVKREDDGVEGALTVNLRLRLRGKPGTLIGNWRELGGRQSETTQRYGWHWVTISGLRLPPGKQVQAAPQYAGVDIPTKPFLPPAKAFSYGPWVGASEAETLILTWSADSFAEHSARAPGRVVALDTKIPWPAEYLRSALLTEDGRPRVKRVVTDVSLYPGAFKTRAFWESGLGAKALEDFRRAGGVVEAEPNPKPIPPVPSGQVALAVR